MLVARFVAFFAPVASQPGRSTVLDTGSLVKEEATATADGYHSVLVLGSSGEMRVAALQSTVPTTTGMRSSSRFTATMRRYTDVVHFRICCEFRAMPTSTDSLGPLLADSLMGDADALNRLLGRIRPYVHVLVRAHVGPAGQLSESSVVQKCLLRIVERRHQLQSPDVRAFLGWVGVMVRNLLADEFRAINRRPEAMGYADEGLAASDSPPEQALERDETAVRVADALGQLPERQRQVVEWRFLDRIPDEEIGRRLGISPGAIRVLRLRALRRLQELLGVVHEIVPEGPS